MLALVRTLHAWTGAALSLVLAVAGLTGALLTFKADWIRLTVPEARATGSLTPRTLGTAADVLERAHGEHLQRMVFADTDLGVHQLFFHDDGYGYAAANGTMLAQWSGPTRPETFVYELHHYLLAGDGGMKVVGVSALAACLLALTGLIVWAPVWRATRPVLWPRRLVRRELIAAHRNLGAVFALPVILFALTGGGIIFYRTAERLLVQAFPGPEAEEFFPPADPGDIDWPRALTAAQAALPDGELRAIVWPEGPWAAAIVKVRRPGEWPHEGESEVLIDPSTSHVLGVKDAQDVGRGYRLFAAMWPVHTAAIGGRLYDILAAASGLALAALGGFGLWSFVIKPRRRRAGP